MTHSSFAPLGYQRCVQSGFTLIEMMVVIAIMAIIAAIAAPSVKEQMARASIIRSAGDIESAFKDARAYALIRKSNIIVTLSGRTLTVSDGATVLNTLTLSNKINITTENSMPTTITFTHLKTATSSSSLPAATANAGFGVCYQGVSTSKKVVQVDAMANIRTIILGNCP